MEKRVNSPKELEREVVTLVGHLSPQKGSATLITLSGELGAGKTTFTQTLARALGVEELVTSPTFVLEKVYDLKNSEFSRLVHIDAYRLDGGEELSSLGFDDIMKDPGTLVVLEWPEKVAQALPKAQVSIALEVLPDNARTITYG